ncbi:MAG: hypothetical protein ACPLW8_02410 [Candidatus Bathyarchaeales archaeon]
MKEPIYVAIALLLSLSLRLYPTLLSGLPFSTDGWPLIRNAELLMNYTPVDIGSNKIFDGYNNYWPLSSIFGVVLSYVLGLKPIEAMALGVPLAGALTILIFYVLVRKVTQEPRVAFLSSILLATAYPYAFFMASVTKETYANPLYMLLLLIFLTDGGLERTLIFTIASVALVSAHHLTTAITIASLLSITVATSIIRMKNGLSVDKSKIILTSILTVIALAYFWTFAFKGFKLVLSASDLISVFSYQLISFAITLYPALKHKASSNKVILLRCFTVLIFEVILVLLMLKTSIVPGAPSLPVHYIFYMVPFAVLFLILAWYEGLSRAKDDYGVVPYFWLAVIYGLEGYAIFSRSSIGLTIGTRALNFLWPPMAIISSAGLCHLYETKNELHKEKLSKAIVAVVAVTVVSIGAFSTYASVSLQERYMAYFFLYTVPEYRGAYFTSAFSNETVLGDVKVFYLLKTYFNVNVDSVRGLEYLVGQTEYKPRVLFVYDQMFKNGYVLGEGLTVDLPKSCIKKILKLNNVYSNGVVSINAW